MLSTHAHTDTQNTDLSGGGNGVIIQSPHTEAFSSLILRIHHIWYEGASGICPLFAFVTDVSSHLHPHLLKKKSFYLLSQRPVRLQERVNLVVLAELLSVNPSICKLTEIRESKNY